METVKELKERLEAMQNTAAQIEQSIDALESKNLPAVFRELLLPSLEAGVERERANMLQRSAVQEDVCQKRIDEFDGKAAGSATITVEPLEYKEQEGRVRLDLDDIVRLVRKSEEKTGVPSGVVELVTTVSEEWDAYCHAVRDANRKRRQGETAEDPAMPESAKVLASTLEEAFSNEDTVSILCPETTSYIPRAVAIVVTFTEEVIQHKYGITITFADGSSEEVSLFPGKKTKKGTYTWESGVLTSDSRSRSAARIIEYVRDRFVPKIERQRREKANREARKSFNEDLAASLTESTGYSVKYGSESYGRQGQYSRSTLRAQSGNTVVKWDARIDRAFPTEEKPFDIQVALKVKSEEQLRAVLAFLKTLDE